MKLFLRITSLLLLISLRLTAQIDNEFWFVAPEIASSHGDSPIFMRISTMDDTANISLRLPADLSFVPIAQKINPNSTYSINLSIFKDLLENNPPNMVHNKGMLLTSDKYVTAYYECANSSNPGIFSLKGKNALGNDFYIVSQDLYQNHDGKESFDIIATEDNTTVTITTSDTIVGHKAGASYTVVLNKGQTYSARAVYSTASRTLAGSHITADKPIAVTWQDDSIMTGGWDIVCDQTIPVNILGKEYIAIKGYADNSPPGNDDERVFILATQDNTDIQVDGVGVATLNAAQQYDHAIPQSTNTAYVKASKPVYVMHLSGHPGEAGASILPQDSCTGSRKVGFNRSSNSAFALLILTRTTNIDSFYLNGSKALITPTDFNPVPGTGGVWSFYRQNNLSTTMVPVGANLLENTKGNFHMGILNNVGASSEYGFFSNYSSLYLGADASICPQDSMVLDGGAFMYSYQWHKKNGSNWVLIDTNRFYTVHDTGTYSCLTNGDFCTLMDTIHISFYPDATVSLGNDTTICQGQTVTLDPGLYLSYEWNTGWKQRTLTTGQPGTYIVTVTNNNNCVATDTVEVFLDSLPQANHGPSGPDTICELQQNILYSVDSLHFSDSYVWTLPTGWTGSSDSSQILVGIPLGVPSGLVRVRGINACGTGPDTSIMVTVKPVPAKAWPVTGPPVVCQGQSGLVYNTQTITHATNYTWSVPPGATITAGAGTTSITVNYGLSSSSGPIVMFGTNDCGNSDTVTFPVTVNLFPQPAGAIAGPGTVCQGQTGVTYSVPAITGADSYVWSLPAGGSITLGNGTPAITVTFDSTAVSGNISVHGHSNNCGDGIASSLPLTVNPLPAPAGTITGLTPVCQGQSGIPYSIIPLADATSYNWTTPSGSSVTTGSGTNQVGIDFSTSAVSGLVTVRGHNAQCGDGRSSSLAVTVNPLPAAAGTITGAGTVCQLATGMPYSIPPVANATVYLWTYTGTGITMHPSSNSNTIDYSSSAVSGDLYVKGNNGCGDGPSSPVLPITVNPAPVMSLQVCNNILTRDAMPFTLRGGIPLGGSWSGDGVSGNIFNPALVSSFTDTAVITYTYTNTYGCSNLKTQKLKIFPVQSFSCGGALKDVRDNRTYPTIILGTQCWMAASLDYGTTIASAMDQQDNCIPEKFCYGDNPANCSSAGGFYQWDEMMQYNPVPGSQGICPPAWHIPTEAEWNVLFAFYISNGFAGSPLKYTGYSGFNALLEGARGNQSSWIFDGFATMLWSSTPRSPGKGWAHGMNSYNPSVSIYPANKNHSFQLRCVKD